MGYNDVRCIKDFPELSNELGVVMLMLFIARIIRQAVGLDFFLAHPLNGKA